MLAAVRGPSTWRAEDAPIGFEDRQRSLVVEHQVESEQGRRDALRHHLARRLLDDPVIYTASLDPDAQAYFINQRGTMASRLCEAAALTAEQRAEGLALTDESGQLTDVSMPAEGTEAHATLLVAEHLAQRLRFDSGSAGTTYEAVAAFLRGSVERYGRYWRKSVREPGAERQALHACASISVAGRSLDVDRFHSGAVTEGGDDETEEEEGDPTPKGPPPVPKGMAGAL